MRCWMWICAVGALAGCQSELGSMPFACDEAAACGAGFYCVPMGADGQGACTDAPVACTSDDVCGPAAVCEAGACVLPPPGRCRETTQCAAGQRCSGGACAAADGALRQSDAAPPDAAPPDVEPDPGRLDAAVPAVDAGQPGDCTDDDCCVEGRPVQQNQPCVKVAAKTCMAACDDTLHEVVLDGFCLPATGRCEPIDGVEYVRTTQCEGACVSDGQWAWCEAQPECGPIMECSGHDDGQGCGAGLLDARCVGVACARWASLMPSDNDRVPVVDLAEYGVLDRFTVDGAADTGLVLTDLGTLREWAPPSDASFDALGSAHEYCRQLATLGGGWRMPTWHEMASMIILWPMGESRLLAPLRAALGPWVSGGWLGVRTVVARGSVLAANLRLGEIVLLHNPDGSPISFRVACVRPVNGAPNRLVDGDARATQLMEGHDVLTSTMWRVGPDSDEVLYVEAARTCSGLGDTVLPTVAQLASVLSHHGRAGLMGPTDELMGVSGWGRFWAKVPGGSVTDHWLVDYGSGEIKRMDAGGTAQVRCVEDRLAGQ